MAKVYIDGVLQNEPAAFAAQRQADAQFFAKPPKSVLLDYAANKRWNVETGGISVGGMSLQTDRESQAKITGAVAATQLDPNFTTDWKTADGWQTLDATTIVIAANAVLDHVKASFAMERSLDDDIEAGNITTREQIDAAAWPANG